ncbi:MAG: FdtA/QdtA family cupin domain-containing protein [Holosporaceae bacterium]|jgi:hypothetical protein|nr:FdtA/QdtA family cupin domain-containing protein [Holosporaceae bacterium]
MLNFCTLFDSNFITYGMVMYESLKKHCDDFHLYIFAFDDISYQTLSALSPKKTTVVSLKEFEDPELLKVKSTRTPAEYCWTCSSAIILYCLKNYKLDHCTYVDADLYFYSNPSVLIDEMQNKSVLITPHNYAPKYDQTSILGKYCVQFITFKNDDAGLQVLNWWRNACLEWCFANAVDGKFGDQKYLDDWLQRFDCVHELRNFGGGVAPWNMSRYEMMKGLKLKVRNIYTDEQHDICFYHFHNIKFSNSEIKGDYFLAYRMCGAYFKRLYLPYMLRLLFMNFRLRKKNESIKKIGAVNLRLLLYLYEDVEKRYRVINLKKHEDTRGKLIAFEGGVNCPFEVKRVFFMYDNDVNGTRGDHVNQKSQFLLIALRGECQVNVAADGLNYDSFALNSPEVALYLNKMTWKEIKCFSKDAVLLVLASEKYDPREYS